MRKYAATTLSLMLLSAASTASAAPMISTGQVVSRQSYQDTRQRGCNTGAPTTCMVHFGNVPPNRRLEIRHVSCQAIMAGAQVVSDAAIVTTTDTLEFVMPLGPPWERTPPLVPGPFYNWNQSIQMFVPAARRASVHIATTGSVSVLCTISGELLTLQ